LNQLNKFTQVWIARPETTCEPVSSAPGNPLSVSKYVELTSLARRNDGCYAQPLFYEGRETRGLGLVVLSRRAGNDFDLHSIIPSICTALLGSSRGGVICRSANETMP